MIFNWKRSHTHDFSLFDENKNVYFFKTQPGFNKASDSEAVQLKADWYFKFSEKKGFLIIENESENESSEKDEKLSLEDINFLQALKLTKAKEVINETVDKRLLEAWLNVEKRVEIKKLIEEQIEEISKKPEKKADK